MRIGIIGDTHFGFSFGTERGEDSYKEAGNAILALLEKSPDVVVLPGDVFDSAVPRQEVLAKTAELILGHFSKREAPSTLKISISGKEHAFRGTPVLAIHGTHERRPKGLTNPLQVLAKAGVLGYFHGERAEISLGTEKVSVFGIGGVPEDYFPEILGKLSPSPSEGSSCNIFVFHQNVSPFVYGAEGITLSGLPKGFDYYVDGHIHWGFLEKTAPEGKPVIFTGSTITTQIRKNESGMKKSVWIIDTAKGEIEEIKFKPFRENLLVEAGSGRDALSILSKLPQKDERPVLRLKISGECPESEIMEISEKFSESFLLSIETARPEGPDGASNPGTPGEPRPTARSEERVPKIVKSALERKGIARTLEEIEGIYSKLLAGKGEEAIEEAISLGKA